MVIAFTRARAGSGEGRERAPEYWKTPMYPPPKAYSLPAAESKPRPSRGEGGTPEVWGLDQAWAMGSKTWRSLRSAARGDRRDNEKESVRKREREVRVLWLRLRE